ncbi:MAG TPA: hypothetical protein PKD00_00380, partial [Burkholderiales bacterium]|nr:hypothetical protein [Burkholderiales bacterium]
YAKSGGNFWRKIGGFAKDWAYNNLQGIPFIGDNIANAVAPDYEYATKVGEKIGGFGKTIKDPLEGFAAGALNIVAPGAGTALKGADDAWDKKQNENIAEKDAMNKMPLSQTNPRFAKSGGRQDINKITPVEGGALEQVSSSGKKIHGRSHQEGGVLLNDEIEVEGREGIHDIDGETVISSATLENPETGNDFAAEMLELEEKKGYLEQRLAAEEKSGNNKNTIIVLKKKIKELDDAIAALYGKQEMVAKEKGLRDAQGNPNEKSQAVVPSPDNPNPSQQISKYGGSVRLKKKYQIGGSNVIPLLEEETTQTALPMPEFQATNPEPEGMYASNTQSLNPNPEATTSNSGLKDFMTAMQQQNPDYSYKAPPTVVPEEEKQKEYNPYNNTSKILPYYNTKQNNDKTYYSNIGNSNKAERNQNYYNQGLNYYSKFGGNTKRDTPQKLSSKYATSVVVPTNKINIPYAATIVPTKEEEVKLLTPTRLINEAKEKAKNIDYISKGAIKTNSEAEALEDLQPTPQVNNPVVSQNTNAQQPIIYYAPSSENNKSDEEKETEKQSKSSFSKTDNEYLKNNREYMIKFYLNKLEDIRRLNKGYIKAKFGGNFTRKKGAFGFNDTSIYGDFKQNNYEPFANSIFKSNDNKSPVYMSNIENKQQQNINNGSTDTGGEGTEKDDRWWFTKALSPIRDKAANNEKILRKRQEEIEKEKNTVKKPTATPYQFIGAMRDMATAIVSPRDNTSQSVTSTNQNPGATVTQSAPVTTTSTPKKVQQPIVTKQPHTEVKDDVRAFQEWNNLNYPNEDLKTDGKYGPKTKAAYEKRKEEWINKYNGKPLDGDKTVATKSDNFTNAVNSGGEIIIIDGVEAVKTADNKIIYKDGSTQNFAPAKISKYGGKYKTGGWIQKATKSIEKRGTEGKCSGSNFGGPGCPPGSKQYNLAVTFRNMARKKHKYGGRFKSQNGSTKYDPFKIKIPIDSPPLKLGPVPPNNYKSKPLYTPEELEAMRKKEKRSDIVEGVVGFLPTAIGG